MDTNKILSANILDLIFDDRNKEYGAYELRKTYTKRITKSLLITSVIAFLIFSGVLLANSLKPDRETGFKITTVDISRIPDDEKKPEPLPEKKKPEPKPQVQTKKLTEFKVVPNEKADDVPPPTQEDLQNSKIDLTTKAGVTDEGLVEPKDIDKGTDIIEENKNAEPDEPFRKVEIEAKFKGNWGRFLTATLYPNVPVENGAPAGKYRVVIQFVVDLEGNISDVKALTNYGYGMEQEAIRAVKKAKAWEPAIQNGRPVKAYRIQPITFEVVEE